MLKYFIASILFTSNLLATSGKESDHYIAEFWQRADGKYSLRVLTCELGKGMNHIYTFENIGHSDKCECHDIGTPLKH